MYCWHCGHKNLEASKFCSDCGKKQANPAELEATGTDNSALLSQADAPSSQPPAGKSLFISRPQICPTDPSIDNAPPKRPQRTQARRSSDKIIVSDPTRSIPEPIPSDFGVYPSLVDKPINLGAASTSAEPTRVVSYPLVNEPGAVHEDVAPKSSPAIAIRKPASRISGPSFLGLSSEPSSDSNYLFDDEDVMPPASSSSWPGVLALTLLIVFGVLLVKQWSTIHDFASNYATKAGLSTGDKAAKTNDAIHHPASAVSASGDELVSNETSTGSNEKKSATTQMASNKSDAPSMQSAEDLQKPESDKLEGAAPANKSTDSREPAYKPSDTSDVNSNTSKPSPEHAESTEAKKSYDNSAIQLAEKYIYGRGVPQDCGRALNLLQSAAGQQNPNAEIKLGALYATGQCVGQDRPQAYVWYSKAKRLEPGNTWLEYSLNSLWASMSDEERRKAQSL